MDTYLIKNAALVDGTGKKPFPGSLLVKGDRIEKIIPGSGKNTKLPKAKKTIDAKGKILSPGFIDIHSHNDFLLLEPNHVDTMQHLMRQGITTVFTGQCGFSPAPLFPDHYENMKDFGVLLSDEDFDSNFPTMNSFFEHMEKQGIAVNMAHMAGHAVLRATLKGLFSADKLSIDDLNRLQYNLDESFDAGAFGLSFGLGYPPGMFSSNKEIEWFAKIAKRHGGIISTHLKAYYSVSHCYPYIPGGTPHNILALKDVLSLAEKVDVPLELSHLIFAFEPTWKTVDRFMKILDKAYQRGVDINFDIFPYKCGNTGIIAVFPTWFIEGFEKNMKNRSMIRKLKIMMALSKYKVKFDLGDLVILKAHYRPYRKYEGLSFHEIARDMGLDVFDSYMKFTELSQGKARILTNHYYDNLGKDGILARLVKHPLSRFSTDVLITREGHQNPATYGSYPRFLGLYSRDLKLITLEEAVHKMTGASARRIGIAKRGELREGYYADLVIFDYNTIAEHGTWGEPPIGIEHVFVNGKPVVKNNTVSRSGFHGKVLRKNAQ